MDCAAKGRDFGKIGANGGKAGVVCAKLSLSLNSFPGLSYSSGNDTLKTFSKSPFILTADIMISDHCTVTW